MSNFVHLLLTLFSKKRLLEVMKHNQEEIRYFRKAERERITKNIESRISDLRACTKQDNCQELANLIESYIQEWTEGEQK